MSSSLSHTVPKKHNEDTRHIIVANASQREGPRPDKATGLVRIKCKFVVAPARTRLLSLLKSCPLLLLFYGGYLSSWGGKESTTLCFHQILVAELNTFRTYFAIIGLQTHYPLKTLA